MTNRPPQLVEHIGFLVSNIEEAIERWERVSGYHFSPIVRYRTNRYEDQNNPNAHFHDARMSFSLEGPPRIELLEATGDGTHGPEQIGVHHLGFRGASDPQSVMDELRGYGIRDDGISRDETGRILLWFTEKQAMDGVRFEYIADLPGPVVADDGSELPRDPVTGRADIWGGRA